ncbi:MAG: thioredoxin family protein [Siphonobacter aquaeclarae]|nr:thioredoxin family protein [Siphonobacter aquaeclarae]
MRKTWVFLLFSLTAQAQVSFIPGNLRTAFNRAASVHKPVFIEVYSPTCHVCESFVPVFNKPSVGKFYNDRFVSYRLDINSQEAQGFLAKQGLIVPSLPLFLFYDENVRLLHAQNLNNTEKEVTGTGSKALNPAERASGYKDRFAKGDRAAAFLSEYSLYTRIVRDTVSNIQVMNAYAKSIRPVEYVSAFPLIKKALLDAENPLFTYFVTHLEEYRKKNAPADVKQAGESVIMATLYSSRGNQMSSDRISKVASYLLLLGFDRKTMENRSLLPELNALFRERKTLQAMTRVDRYLQTTQPGLDEYLYLSNYLPARSSDPLVLRKAAELKARAQKK